VQAAPWRTLRAATLAQLQLLLLLLSKRQRRSESMSSATRGSPRCPSRSWCCRSWRCWTCPATPSRCVDEACGMHRSSMARPPRSLCAAVPVAPRCDRQRAGHPQGPVHGHTPAQGLQPLAEQHPCAARRRGRAAVRRWAWPGAPGGLPRVHTSRRRRRQPEATLPPPPPPHPTHLRAPAGAWSRCSWRATASASCRRRSSRCART
jgi:hypothetical protein